MIISGEKRCINCMHTLYDSNKCEICGYDQDNYKQTACCLSPGTELSKRYVTGKVIGEGGFGITYIGWDKRLESTVAIKEFFPLDAVTRDVINGSNNVTMVSADNEKSYRDKLEKFLNEARCLTKFNQLPGVVSVRDFFYGNETAYIVMEYVNGCSIKKYIDDNGKMQGEQVLDLMKPVMKALIEIHKTGLIHRDISPDNILISEKKELFLIDFGASRLRDIDFDKSMTVTFKRGFSPEEQYRSKGKTGTWTDVYSLCATMYYMLTGIVPKESIERIVGIELQSLEEIQNINLSQRQKKAIMKGMALDANDRYQNVSQLVAELYSVDNDEPYGIHKKKKVKNRKYFVGCAVIIASAIILWSSIQNKNSYDKYETETMPPVVEEADEKTPALEHNSHTFKDPNEENFEIYEMVSCVGLKEKVAKEKLEALNAPSLDIVIKKIYHSDYEEGVVVSQSVEEGTRWYGYVDMKITLYVSKGEEDNISRQTFDTTVKDKEYEMVSCVGLSQKEAKQIINELTDASVKIKITKQYNAKYKKGIVVEQSIKEGTICKKDDTIVLYVSKGKKINLMPSNNNNTDNKKENNGVLGQITDEEDDVIGVIE